ncbi:hypothetical protein SRABI83_03544 [Arthrobacter sp. Bi83]|uniref:glycosyltransferase family 2 protein n=1 Tax=Arthrobacter sp. Bi83 TaxID=2822353 RepID=UPI001DC0585A|nr:glycosyltransferase family 2 protein [Arthrobacter sp. Bi83]CAH0267126.1 hypothetical protein SRABI83_03544 [Arthrobacter sp. Bi83]
MSITVVILTYNEALHIERAIRSVQFPALATKIYVVDSFSRDGTQELARSLGAEVVEHAFTTQSQQFQWALDTLPIETEWILRLDADEIIYEDLALEILQKTQHTSPSVGGFTLNRRHIFFDKWIRHGGRYPLRLLRLWRTGHGRVEDRWMDEHVVLTHGSVEDLSGRFEDRNLNDLSYFIGKHNAYASREALEQLATKYGLRDASEQHTQMSNQARVKRFIKERFYNRLPYPLTSTAYFVFRIVLQFGFLDGSRGLIYHFLQGFWYRFLVGAKVYEIESVLRSMPSTELQIVRLQEYASEFAK